MDADAEIFFDSFVNSLAAGIERSFLSEVVALDVYAAKIPDIPSMFAEGAREAWVARMESVGDYQRAEHEKAESAVRESVARNVLARHAAGHPDMSPVDASTKSYPAAELGKAKSELVPELTTGAFVGAEAYADVVSDTLYQREYNADVMGNGLVSLGNSELLQHPEVTRWVPNSLAAAVALARESVGRDETLREMVEPFLDGLSVHAAEKLAERERQRHPESSTPRGETLAETEMPRKGSGPDFVNVISERVARIVSERAPSALEKEIENTPGTPRLTKNTKAAASEERRRQHAERERNQREFPASRLEPQRMSRWSGRLTQLREPPQGLGPVNSPQTPSLRATPPGRTAAGPDSGSLSVAAIGFTKPEPSQPPSRSAGWAAGTQVNSRQADLSVGPEIIRELRT